MAKNKGKKKNHNKVKKKKLRVKAAPSACSNDGSSSSHSESGLERPVAEETVEAVACYTQRVKTKTSDYGWQSFLGKPIHLRGLPERFNVGKVPLYSRLDPPFVQCSVCSNYTAKIYVTGCGHRFCEDCSRFPKNGRRLHCPYCRTSFPTARYDVKDDMIASALMQCRCGLEGNLEEIKKHVNSRKRLCLDSTFGVRQLVTYFLDPGKSNRWIGRSQYLLPRYSRSIEQVRPPETFDDFLESVPRNPDLPHAYIDFEADGLYLGRLYIELREDIVPKTVAEFIKIVNDPRGYKGAVVDFILPDGFFQVKNVPNRNQVFFPDENFDLKHDQAGTVSMCNFGENTNHSGFYVAAKPLPWRDGFNVVFGYVISGLEVINRICELGREDGSLRRRVRILDCGLVVEWIIPSCFDEDYPVD